MTISRNDCALWLWIPAFAGMTPSYWSRDRFTTAIR
jgi:hypothetical protein